MTVIHTADLLPTSAAGIEGTFPVTPTPDGPVDVIEHLAWLTTALPAGYHVSAVHDRDGFAEGLTLAVIVAVDGHHHRQRTYGTFIPAAALHAPGPVTADTLTAALGVICEHLNALAAEIVTGRTLALDAA